MTYKIELVKTTLKNKGLSSASAKWLLLTKMKDYEKSEANLARTRENLKKIEGQGLIRVDLRKITINNFISTLESLQNVLETGYTYVKSKDPFTNESIYHFHETTLTSDEDQDEDPAKQQNSTITTDSTNNSLNSSLTLGESNNTSGTNYLTAESGNSSVMSVTENNNTNGNSSGNSPKLEDVLPKVTKATGKFNKGETSMERYIDHFESNCVIFKVTESDKIIIFKNLLSSHEVNEIIKLDSYKDKTYEQLKPLIIMICDGDNKRDWKSAAHKLTSMKFDNYDGLCSFFIDFSKTSAQLSNKIPEDVLAIWFQAALPQYAHDHLSTLEISDVMTAFKHAQAIMNARPKNETSIQGARSNQRGNSRNNRGNYRGNSRGSRGSGFRGSNGRNQEPRRCYNCQRPGHIARECRQPNQQHQNQQNSQQQSYPRHQNQQPIRAAEVKDTNTGEFAAQNYNQNYSEVNKRESKVHELREVKKVNKEREKESVTKGPLTHETINLNLISFEDNSGIRVKTQIGSHSRRKNIEWIPTVDSAAKVSVIDQRTAEKLNIEIDRDIKVNVILADNSHSENVMGKAKNNSYFFKIPGSQKHVNFCPIIMASSRPIGLMGIDVIKDMGGGHFYEKMNGSMGFKFNIESELNYKSYKVRAADYTIIEPGRTIPLEVSKPRMEFTSEEVKLNFKPTNRPKNYKFQKQGSQRLEDSVKITNPGNTPITVNKGEVIGTLHVETEEENAKPKEDSAIWKNYLKLVSEKTAHIQCSDTRKKAQKMLLRRWKVFSEGCGVEVGSANDIVLRLNPEDEKIKVPQQKRRPYGPQVWEVVEKEMEMLLKLGIIEKCGDTNVSPANLVLVKDKKGKRKIRVCVDYVHVNQQLPSHSQPLPTMTEMLDTLQNSNTSSYYSKFDVSKCFHNFKIDKRDRKYTAFFGPKSVWQYKQLPFGLKSAPGLVQQYQTNLLNSVSAKLSENANAAVYLDDGLVHSTSKEKGISDLEIILEEYEKRNIRLKIEKLEILKKKINFMGVNCEATKNGAIISSTEESLEAIRNLRAPQNTKELRGMLGMLGWLSEFLPKLNLRLFPFFELLKKTNVKKGEKPVKFLDYWSEDHQKYFEEVKNIMPESICVPDYNAQFEIEVDSSCLGHAACLYQSPEKGKRRMIMFASKKLPPAAINYSNDHREVAGVIFALEKFQRYIQLHRLPTIVHTDNRVAAFLKTAKAPKLVRYRIWMNQFNLELRHKPGTKMLFSDAFSRLIKNNTKKYIPGQSDKLLQEMEIAKIEDKTGAEHEKNLALMQAHYRNNHASAEALHILTGAPLAKCLEVKKKCFTCLANEKVRVTKQNLGNLEVKPEKNSLWCLDFCFMTTKPFLTVLDAATKRLFVFRMPNRELKHVVTKLMHLFENFGTPSEIVGDLEFHKQPLLNFLANKEVKVRNMARHAPFLNLVERTHGHLKMIGRRNNADLVKACVIYNASPFLDLPTEVKISKWCPLKLYSLNDVKIIKLLREVREKESRKRQERKEESRGANFVKREFLPGQNVKFMTGKKSEMVNFGQIMSKMGKIYEVRQMVSNKIFKIHAQELERVGLSVENLNFFLK